MPEASEPLSSMIWTASMRRKLLAAAEAGRSSRTSGSGQILDNEALAYPSSSFRRWRVRRRGTRRRRAGKRCRPRGCPGCLRCGSLGWRRPRRVRGRRPPGRWTGGVAGEGERRGLRRAFGPPPRPGRRRRGAGRRRAGCDVRLVAVVQVVASMRASA